MHSATEHCDELHFHIYCTLASFPSPAQLSVTFIVQLLKIEYNF